MIIKTMEELGKAIDDGQELQYIDPPEAENDWFDCTFREDKISDLQEMVAYGRI